MSTEHQPLNLAQIRTDGGTQTRATLNAETIREYAEAMTRGEEFPPVVVFYDGSQYWLADGFHRVQAAKDADQDEIDADVRQGTQRDAVLHSVAANAKHGLPRCAEDKRRAVLRLLEDDEWSIWSDRKIAEVTRTSHPFVGKLRRDAYGDDIPAERTVERDGQQYTMSTDGINADREPSAHALAHEYMPRILDMLPETGLLYLTIRNQLGVRQSNKTQMDALQIALDTLFGEKRLAKKHGRYVRAEGDPDITDDDAGGDDARDLIDHIDPVTAEVTQVPASSASEPDPADPDAETREWFREHLRENPRHYNILTRIARTDGISTKAFIRVARAMIDDNEVELDGMIYKLTGDSREQPALPDELSADEKATLRDALINAVRDEALTSTQINNAIHAATGKKLDILYLINWLDMLARDEKLIKTAENGHMPRYQLNPNPPSDAEIQQRRQAADIETRLDIVRRAIADRLPTDQINVTWLKRAAPLAVANAAEAGELLTRLVDLGELRLTGGGTVNYELIEVPGAAESTDPGQDGEPAVERAGEPHGRDALPPTAGTSPAPLPDEHAQQYSTALLHRGQFEKALFALDDAFKAVRVIRSIQTWHTLNEQQIEKTRQAIAMARTWLFNLDGFLEAFDDALVEIADTGEPYLELVEAKPLEDEAEV